MTSRSLSPRHSTIRRSYLGVLITVHSSNMPFLPVCDQVCMMYACMHNTWYGAVLVLGRNCAILSTNQVPIRYDMTICHMTNTSARLLVPGVPSYCTGTVREYVLGMIRCADNRDKKKVGGTTSMIVRGTEVSAPFVVEYFWNEIKDRDVKILRVVSKVVLLSRHLVHPYHVSRYTPDSRVLLLVLGPIPDNTHCNRSGCTISTCLSFISN